MADGEYAKMSDFLNDLEQTKTSNAMYEIGYKKGREDAINEVYHKFEEVVKLDSRESYYWTVIWRLFQKTIDEMGKDINVPTKKEGEKK